MLNKGTAKLPPRIEKWVMDMQNGGFELLYLPGKDAADRMDYLSWQPLSITGTGSAEKVVKSILTAEHAIVLDRFRKETAKDKQLHNLYKRKVKEDWQKYRTDHGVLHFFIRHKF